MFRSARFKLTAWYLAIIMLISLTFSAVIYETLMREVQRFAKMQQYQIQRQILERTLLFPGEYRVKLPDNLLIGEDLVREIRGRILLMLGSVNLGILLIAGALGYILAGRTLNPIREMVIEQNRFISDASHELKTPLTSLKSAFEVYLRSDRPTVKEAKTLVNESIDEVNKLQSLSESLLKLAQYQKPSGNIKPEVLSIAKITEEAITKMQTLAEKKQITIEKNITDLKVVGDKYGIGDLVIILLDNAIKYSPANRKIYVESKRDDGWGIISVQDFGTGIARKDLPHIFERFYRADTARSKNGSDGYGLGLSIAKKIADNNKAEIDVVSQVGKGTTFTVRLPRPAKREK